MRLAEDRAAAASSRASAAADVIAQGLDSADVHCERPHGVRDYARQRGSAAVASDPSQVVLYAGSPPAGSTTAATLRRDSVGRASILPLCVAHRVARISLAEYSYPVWRVACRGRGSAEEYACLWQRSFGSSCSCWERSCPVSAGSSSPLHSPATASGCGAGSGSDGT